MQKPVLRPIAVPMRDAFIKVTALHWTENAGLSVELISKQTQRFFAVKFQAVEGVRSLHELDLASFWLSSEKQTLSSSYLFEVCSGGWLELEATRQDFYTKHEASQPREYLIAGYQECVSVLSFSEPELQELPHAGA